MGGDFAPQGIFGKNLETFVVVTMNWVGAATDMYWAEAGDTAKDPTMHWPAPHNRELSGPK